MYWTRFLPSPTFPMASTFLPTGLEINLVIGQSLSATLARTLLRFRSNDAGMPDGALITGGQVIAVAALPPIPSAWNTIPVP